MYQLSFAGRDRGLARADVSGQRAWTGDSGRKSNAAPMMSDGVIPLLRPLLPTLETLSPYLRELEENRWYTNFGPLVRRFEKRLAEHVRVPAAGAAVFSNGTTALSSALIALDIPPGKTCLVPAWAFVASAVAIWAAHLVPHFVDVSPETWMPDPRALRRRSDLAEVGAVMVVGPFGTPVETAAWDAFSADTGVPVIIDGAACFDTAASVPQARPGRSQMMISLHATKALGVGEGGFVISTDEAVVHRARHAANFGIGDSPDDESLGYNGKMSEYHAAVGLAALDGWPKRRAELESRTARYVSELSRVPSVHTSPSFGEGWVSAYCTVRIDGDAGSCVERLRTLGVEARRWWRDGIHAQRIYRDCPRDALPVTQDLAAHVLSLPFSPDMTDAHIVRVVDGLAEATAS
ncbi:MAG: hypothetical protein QOF71_2667 [Candidatus Eremiobacteraeota bacterium]|jgi:dTDP-4-amino-4,6-dideoxygalactose transaminase|nr:hypothetical protein [Candidatus Eremiobacteraeota bacterium]